MPQQTAAKFMLPRPAAGGGSSRDPAFVRRGSNTGASEIAPSLGSQPRSGYALPKSRTQRHFRIQRPQPATAQGRTPSASAACFPAGSAAYRTVAAIGRRAYGMPHGRARSLIGLAGKIAAIEIDAGLAEKAR